MLIRLPTLGCFGCTPWLQSLLWLSLLWLISLPFMAFAASAPPLRVLVGMHKPPYIDMHAKQGYELELLRLVAHEMQQAIEFKHAPNQRLLELLKKGEGDIATLQSTAAATSNEPALAYGCPYIRYQNVAVSLHRNRILLRQINDLGGVSILAFQNAARLLPLQYQQTVQHAPDYRETIDQATQVEMLQKNRVQVIILDINIFRHYNALYPDAAPTDIYRLFAPTTYRTAFRDAKLAQSFDQALARVQQTQAYIDLQLKYFKQLDEGSPPLCLSTAWLY